MCGRKIHLLESRVTEQFIREVLIQASIYSEFCSTLFKKKNQKSLNYIQKKLEVHKSSNKDTSQKLVQCRNEKNAYVKELQQLTNENNELVKELARLREGHKNCYKNFTDYRQKNAISRAKCITKYPLLYQVKYRRDRCKTLYPVNIHECGPLCLNKYSFCK